MTKQLSQKYCLVSLLEPVEIGEVFSWKDWALHITFAGVHFAEWNDEMISNFQKSIESVNCFEVNTLGQITLGSIEAIAIDNTYPVTQLHNLLLDFLDNQKAVFNNPEWNRQNFVPHSTIQKHSQVPQDSVLMIDNIALVDMFPNGDGYKRKVIRMFNLS